MFGHNKEELGDWRLKKILELMEKIGTTLIKKRCSFGVKEVIFLDHKVSELGISPDPNKVKAIIVADLLSRLAGHPQINKEKELR